MIDISLDSLSLVRQRLLELSHQSYKWTYRIPTLWKYPTNYQSKLPSTLVSSPFSWILETIDTLMSKSENQQQRTEQLSWLQEQVCYSLYVRHCTAFDHTDSGDITLSIEPGQLRNTGTFLKTIALLPYLQSLGITTLFLLPISLQGKIAQKGTLGSPYATKDHYVLEPMLSEPALGLTAEIEFSALVALAHTIGIKIVCEFALRTVSRDSTWIERHPEWFYWIQNHGQSEHFHPPYFSADQIESISQQFVNHDYTNLPTPTHEYIHQFTHYTQPDALIPSAFADYPPNDTQPLWSDVTYLKLYDSPSYNYVAYNTIRLYPPDLTSSGTHQESLWQTLEDIIPYYINQFGIDGAILDMSHALPDELRKRIITKARLTNPQFVFIEENFSILQESKDLGFDAVLGSAWHAVLSPNEYQQFLRDRQKKDTDILWIATPDTHNTPRIFATRSNYPNPEESIIILYSELWNTHHGVKTLLAGSEFGEVRPINTGLGFTHEQNEEYTDNDLPLFSAVAMDWCSYNSTLLSWFQNRHSL